MYIGRRKLREAPVIHSLDNEQLLSEQWDAAHFEGYVVLNQRATPRSNRSRRTRFQHLIETSERSSNHPSALFTRVRWVLIPQFWRFHPHCMHYTYKPELRARLEPKANVSARQPHISRLHPHWSCHHLCCRHSSCRRHCPPGRKVHPIPHPVDLSLSPRALPS